MDYTISALDEYFMAHYSDYTRLAALSGYKMPETLVVGANGSIEKKDPSVMRLMYQENREKLLARFKEEQGDTDLTFSFRFLTLAEKLRRPFEKYTFSKVLPKILNAHKLTAEEAGRRLNIEPKFWKKLQKGTLVPEKNTVLALALTCAFTPRDTDNLFNACGFVFDDKSVRDVVVRFLLEQKVFSPDLIFACLREYKIDCLPIRRATETSLS